MKNSLPINKHEDERRVLIEWIQDFPMRSAKVVITKKETVLGEHYHDKKSEVFYLLKGGGKVTLGEETEELNEGDVVFVPEGVRHAFRLNEGAVLLGVGSKPYDKNDEHV